MGQPASNRESSASGGRPKILVVEDNYLVAELICDMLGDCDCEVLGPAPDIETAEEIVRGEQMNGALLDVNLAGKTSFSIAAALQERNVPFVFVTGYDQPAVFPDGLKSVPRISKPFQRATLQTIVDARFRNQSQ